MKYGDLFSSSSQPASMQPRLIWCDSTDSPAKKLCAGWKCHIGLVRVARLASIEIRSGSAVLADASDAEGADMPWDQLCRLFLHFAGLCPARSTSPHGGILPALSALKSKTWKSPMLRAIDADGIAR